MFSLRGFVVYVATIVSIVILSSFATAQDRGPTETAKQLFTAVEKKDAETFKGLMCKDVRDYLETSTRKIDLLEAFMGIVEWGKPDKSATASETIEGDKATVTFTKKNADGSSESSKVELTKDGDRWAGFCLTPKQLEGFQLTDKMAARFAAAKAVDESQIRKEIEDFYAKRDQAFKAKDIDTFKSMETDDYKTVAWFIVPGVSTRQEADENLTRLMQTSYRAIQARSTKVNSIKRGADENEFFVETARSMRWTNQQGANSGETKQHDMLVRTKDGWKIKYEEIVDFDFKPQ